MRMSYFAWVVAALFLGCVPRSEPMLVLRAERIEVAFDQQRPDSVRVAASEAWVAESSESWCRVEVPNDSTLYIQVDQYAGASKRQATVRVSIPDRQATLLVTQGTAPGGDFLRYRDSLALEAIYRQGNGSKWVWEVGFEEIEKGWDRSQPIGQWVGVTTERIDGSLRVRGLDLRTIDVRTPDSLAGALADSVVLLNKLSAFYVGSFPFTQSPLPLLAKLERLEVLDISFAPYPLVWPADLGGLKSLAWLYASGIKHPSNRLGEGWNELQNLQLVELAGCGLEGGFPETLLEKRALVWLDLSNNPKMGGRLPVAIRGLSGLEHLDVSLCGLQGTLPVELGDLLHLITLKAAGNPELGGVIPASLGTIDNLQTLNLSSCGFTELPLEVWNAAHLRYVDVSFNRLQGTIPVAVASMQHLAFLGLVGNQMSGVIPAEVLQSPKWQQRSGWYYGSWICPQQTGYGFSNCQ